MENSSSDALSEMMSSAAMAPEMDFSRKLFSVSRRKNSPNTPAPPPAPYFFSALTVRSSDAMSSSSRGVSVAPLAARSMCGVIFFARPNGGCDLTVIIARASSVCSSSRLTDAQSSAGCKARSASAAPSVAASEASFSVIRSNSSTLPAFSKPFIIVRFAFLYHSLGICLVVL